MPITLFSLSCNLLKHNRKLLGFYIVKTLNGAEVSPIYLSIFNFFYEVEKLLNERILRETSCEE